MSNIFTLEVNGETVAIPNTFTAQGTANWVTYEEYLLANVKLVKDENTIVLTVTGGCGNYDYMKLVSTQELSMPSLVTEVSLRTTAALLKTGEPVSLVSTVSPASATNKTLAWSSSDANVATVDANGVVTAVGEGVVVITATSLDGSEVSGSVKLFVSDQDGDVYEAENAELTNCTVESNGSFVGGINNEGAKVTFTVNSESEQTVLLRVNTSVVRDGEFSITNFFTLAVNDTDIDETQGTFAATSPYGWNLDNGSYVVEITLIAGVNTIVLSSVGTTVATTLNYIAIY